VSILGGGSATKIVSESSGVDEALLEGRSTWGSGRFAPRTIRPFIGWIANALLITLLAPSCVGGVPDVVNILTPPVVADLPPERIPATSAGITSCIAILISALGL
jgi:hypothetical protein